MREKSIHTRGRGRGTGILATLAAMASILVASVGAAPAQAQQTQTAWIPLRCVVAGVIPTAMGAALTTTVPDTVAPGDTFSLQNTSATVIVPNSVQQAAAVFSGDAIQGIVSDFQTNLTNATANFQDTAAPGQTQTSPTQFNAVAAVQPLNQPATGNPRINGGDTTRGGFQPATPPESFSFGDVPADITGATHPMFGPVPGIGGGPNPTDGTPDILPPVGPLAVPGTVTGDVVIVNRNPGGPPVMADSQNFGPRVMTITISFHEQGSGDPGTYTQPIPFDCAFDNRPPDPSTPPQPIGNAGSVPKPVASWVDQFTIPIVDGVGSASVRGTFPATFGAVNVPAQISAIINCDEAQSTRPYIVRWTAGGTTYTFTKTSVDTSRCFSSTGFSVNQGSGEGTVNGVHATSTWTLVDGSQAPAPDAIDISIEPDSGDPLTLGGGGPQPLFGTPGGVWVFGNLPWPPR